MPQDFGSGVSRTLSALQRQFQVVVWQKSRPPLDSEVNLMGQMDMERSAQIVRANMHSGFLLDPLDAQRDFVTDPSWSNFFKLGRPNADEQAPSLWANVNGWIIPVTGTAVSDGDVSNRVDLYPPPSTDARIDLVFLEVFLAQVAPNPSTDNKPSADKVWKYGNVKFGGTNVTDDLEDPTVGYETSERVQAQYRLRLYGQGSGLGNSVDLAAFPDGLDDPNVVGQGTASTPVTGFSFTNMRAELGDPGLWRAGDGDANNALGTVDGYTYAIPIAAIFRRNSDAFVARTDAGNPNQNGAVDRNPITVSITDPAEATKVFGTATLTNTISEVTTGVVQVTGLAGSVLDNAAIDWTSTFLVLDGEVIRISEVDTSVSPATMTIRATGGRGRWGTMAVPHLAGTVVQVFNWRHDGLFADQIAPTDLLDLRKGVTMGEWDYNSLLAHNLSKLFQGELRTSYKQGKGDSQGAVVVEVDEMLSTGDNGNNQVEFVDGPDGIRTIFSDGASIQPDVTMLLDNNATQVDGQVTRFDTAPATYWSVNAGFLPGGFMTDSGSPAGWQNGSSIFLYIGGSNGSQGARASMNGERAVRFVTPKEYWSSTSAQNRQHPVTLRFIAERAMNPAGGTEPVLQHPGPMYPLPDANFERPYCVLGGILNTDSISTTVSVYNVGPNVSQEVEIPGLDFDAIGDWFSKDGSGRFQNDPSLVTKPVLHGNRTLWGMITQDGRDRTGASSEVYLVIWGDTTTSNNNGLFRVIGAGTSAGYTQHNAAAANRLVVEFINAPSASQVFVDNTGLNAEMRSQFSHSEDGNGSASASTSGSAMCIVLTDLEGEYLATRNPWNATNLAALAIATPVLSKMVLSTTLQYHPGRGATARVADALDRFAVVTAGSEYLRQAPSSRDGSFPSQAGVPDGETYFDLNHVQTWNRLTSQGLSAPEAPDYGGGLVAFSEAAREAEVFIDPGSKTIMFRPFLTRNMTLFQHTISSGQLVPTTLDGSIVVDGAGIFLGLTKGYEVPQEFMPRFGRQDIPFYVDTTGTGSGSFLQGINHLFNDGLSTAPAQFSIIGGEPTTPGVPTVKSIRFQTSSALLYGQWGGIPNGGGTNGFKCRLYTNVNIQSSDVGAGLRGIQLPPFYGIARIYGVYDWRDYRDAGGSTFESNRVTPSAGAPPNLLRTDAAKQTLYLLQGGAEDVTGNADDHTYIIPENAIDISLSGNYVAGETFGDIQYVVECLVFGFSRGWVNKNNYVMARGLNGQGLIPPTQLDGAVMVIPAPASEADLCYTAYNRTVYQGDPYMTRDGSNRTTSDYENRYGQVAQSDAFELGTPIQQFDANGDQIPEIPNARALEVLAAVDFWTTLGTGKVGGGLFPGTPLDVGYTTPTMASRTRIPAASTSDPWQVTTRAFSEGQKTNLSHGSAALSIISNADINGGDTLVFVIGGMTTVTLTAGVDWAVGATATASISNLSEAIRTSADLQGLVQAWGEGQQMSLVAVQPGDDCRRIEVSISNTLAFALRVAENLLQGPGPVTDTPLVGGVDIPTNGAIPGTSAITPIRLTGMTERLPMGILLQDADFLGEDPLRDGASHLRSAFGSASANTRTAFPLTGGEEYTRSVGGVGTYVALADGGILKYTPYTDTTPTGTKKFRLYRGGGSSYIISGDNPGGPVDWVAGAFPEGLLPVLKGGVLAGRAFLVRNFPEEAFSGNETTSHGDELQMVIMTQGILGEGLTRTQSVSLSGVVSPTGYGEGYSAADRYRLEGKPQSPGHQRAAPATYIPLAPFPDDSVPPGVIPCP